MFTITLSTKGCLLFILYVQLRCHECTTVLSPAGRVVSGQDVELVCTYSSTIDPTSTVFVTWNEGDTIQGNIDKNCSQVLITVNTTLYGFSCPSIRNYTWTILDVQESRNGSLWTCEFGIDSPNFVSSDPTAIYVISPITNVTIDGNTNVSADAGSQATVSCTTSTGRPMSTIRWYFDAGTPSDISDDEEITSTLEPVFDFGSETTSGSVTITAQSNMNGWGIYAMANNTESMTPIQSPRVTLTVTDSTHKCSPWCLCNLCECILAILLPLLGGIGGCIAVAIYYSWSEGKCCFKDGTLNQPVVSGGIHSGRSIGTGIRVPSTTGETLNETSHETKRSRTTVHADNQVTDKTKGRITLPPIKGNAKVEPGGNPEKNTAGQITEVNNTYRALPIPTEIGSEVSSQAPNMGAVEANNKKKKKKKKRKETKEDQIV